MAGARTIDIGAGLGVATIPALKTGASVIANDIADEHLRQISVNAENEGLRNKLDLLNASLPRLPALHHLDAIHASNVLHFLTGPEMQMAARWMAGALKPQGRLFLQTISPFTGHFRRFRSEYDRRKAAGLSWPGEMSAAKEYVEPSLRDMTPSFMHALDAKTAADLFQNAGFEVEYCDYYRRPGLPDVCCLDGRENLGIVGRLVLTLGSKIEGEAWAF
jgi:2-polyprenyl-3-methyl-5-hydroxy-6-metoxy-1,4-benzoquinol methylase